MAVTKASDVLSSVKTGIALNPADGIKSSLKKERKLLASPSDPTEITDAAQDLKDALTYLQQSATVIAASGEAAFSPQIALLATAWPTLPADDPTAGVVDQKKVRNQTRTRLTEALALTPAAPPAPDTVSWLWPRIEDFKRRLIGDYQGTDPCEATFTTARAALAAAATQQSVDDAVATINRLAHLLSP